MSSVNPSANPVCWLCNGKEPSPASQCKVAMHGNVQVKYKGNYEGRIFDKATLAVPRCPGRAEAHRARHNAGVGAGIMLAAVPVILALTSLLRLLGESGVEALLLIPVLAILVFLIYGVGYKWLGGFLAYLLVLRPRGVRPISTAASHPAVLNMVGRGWRLGDSPSKGVFEHVVNALSPYQPYE